MPLSPSGSDVDAVDLDEPLAAGARRWRPRRVVVTPAALDHPHGQRILARVEAAGLEVERLTANRVTGVRGDTDRETYARAKATLAVVVSPPSCRVLQPIAPSADWRVDFAEGCPAHCQYCYLAGSLTGPPITRVYADLDDILAGLEPFVGRGTITSRSARRATEGTTFEASCYTDPLALEHLTGSWSRAVEFFGGWQAPVQLRWTTKYDDVEPFLGIAHARRTRIRLSVNCAAVSGRFEGGTSPVPARLAALRRVALAGYPVGLTIAPIMPVPDWEEQYGTLLAQVREAVSGVPELDLTAELITHRFTPGSKDVLLGWYPRTTLEMDEARRRRKTGKFGQVKYVYAPEEMGRLRSWFDAALARELPRCQVLYWT